MTIDEAIVYLSDCMRETERVLYPEILKAHMLGVAALKWRQLMEHDYGSWCGPLLEGETLE